jgi:uncharacterized protein involved in cysteine biosynthesis
MVLGLWSGTLACGALAAFGAALFVSAPLLEGLGRKAEALQAGSAPAAFPSRAEILGAWARAWYFTAAVPLAFLLSLLPFLGPILGGWCAAEALCLQATAGPLARRGKDLRARLSWNREWRAENLGFGVATLLLAPLVSPVLAPALVVGAALFVYEIEGNATATATPSTPEPALPEDRGGDAA